MRKIGYVDYEEDEDIYIEDNPMKYHDVDEEPEYEEYEEEPKVVFSFYIGLWKRSISLTIMSK